MPRSFLCFGALLLLLTTSPARADEALAITTGMQMAPTRYTFLANGPHPALGLAVIERHLLTRYTGADLSLGIAADLMTESYRTSEAPPEWYRVGQLRDRWLAASQAVRAFVSPLPALDLGVGLGLHEVLPMENSPGAHGDRQRAGFEKLHHHWRRHMFVRLDFNPGDSRGLVLEFEHQRAFRRADYWNEPLRAYVFKLGYRFRA